MGRGGGSDQAPNTEAGQLTGDMSSSWRLGAHRTGPGDEGGASSPSREEGCGDAVRPGLPGRGGQTGAAAVLEGSRSTVTRL